MAAAMGCFVVDLEPTVVGAEEAVVAIGLVVVVATGLVVEGELQDGPTGCFPGVVGVVAGWRMGIQLLKKCMDCMATRCMECRRMGSFRLVEESLVELGRQFLLSRERV
jgi:hypothetical protein